MQNIFRLRMKKILYSMLNSCTYYLLTASKPAFRVYKVLIHDLNHFLPYSGGEYVQLPYQTYFYTFITIERLM